MSACRVFFVSTYKNSLLGRNRLLFILPSPLINIATQTTPPSFAGLIGLVTTNGSWGAGFAGKLHLADDAWRLTAAAMYLDIRFTFYGIGQAAAQGVKLREEIVPIRLEGLRRVAPHVYLGLRGQVSKVSIGLNFDSMPPPFAPFVPDPKAFQEVLLAPIFEFDNRDDQMYPTRGWLVNASASFFDSAIGSDSTMPMVNHSPAR